MAHRQRRGQRTPPGPSREALLAHYAGRGIDCGDAVGLWRCSGAHADCGCEPDCHGECVGNDLFAGDARLSIINLANIPAVPVVRGDAIGFAAVGWHTHRDRNGPTGGEPDYPFVVADSRQESYHWCAGYNCDSLRYSGDIIDEITYRLVSPKKRTPPAH